MLPLRMFIIIGAITGAATGPVATPPTDYRVIVGGTIAALLTLILIGLPFYSKIHDAILTLSKPLIREHNVDPKAHEATFGNVHEAVVLLQKSVTDLQRQIDGESLHRKDSLLALQRQLEQAVELLRPL